MAENVATALDYDTLPAGKELDILVAEKVMGWEVVELHRDATRTPYVLGLWHTLILVDRVRMGSEEPFSPSTDIAAAWLLADLLFQKNAYVLSGGFRGGYEVFQITNTADYESETIAQADTAPLAMCRAALKAITTE